MKILVATEKPFAPVAVEGIREQVENAGHTLALLEKYTDRQQLVNAVADADALIVRSDIVDADIVAAAPKLKIVVRAGAGYDNIDLVATKDRGIVVENTPGQNSNAVAELVFGLAVMAVRNMYAGTAGWELRGRRLGIHAEFLGKRTKHRLRTAGACLEQLFRPICLSHIAPTFLSFSR